MDKSWDNFILRECLEFRDGAYRGCVARHYRRPTELARILGLFHIDFPYAHKQPAQLRAVLASIVALVGSLGADAILVAIGKALFPITKHYAHFRPLDYGRLTIIGVVIACVAWPIVTWVSSTPRWLFFRSAIAVTLVLLLPDLYLLYRNQPAKAVFVLMVMHLAIGFITYNSLVRIAPSKWHEVKGQPNLRRQKRQLR